MCDAMEHMNMTAQATSAQFYKNYVRYKRKIVIDWMGPNEFHPVWAISNLTLWRYYINIITGREWWQQRR